MIQVDDVSVSYDGEAVFEGVTFTVSAGERCGLVGRNGSGKTTLFRLLVGLEKADGGRISFSKGYRLGYLDQHIRFTQPSVIEEACLGLQESERDQVYKAEKMLMGLGFSEEEMELPCDRFSGGFQLRLHLAKVLLSEPDCLLLDEPTNYLDILSIRFLERFLQRWRGELVLISHDREFMDSVTTHTLGIHRKAVRKVQGSTVDYFNQLVMQEEVYEKTRMNLEKKRAHLQSFVDRFGAKASKAAQAQARVKMLSRIPAMEELKKLYDLDFNFHERPFHGQKMLEAMSVDFCYAQDKPLIRALSLAIERGERLAIIGKNGYGKSTVLRLFAQELAPQQGEIKFSDQASIGYFGQTNIQRLAENKTIEEEIWSAHSQLTFSEVRRICGQMMFSGDKAKKKIGVLSGGEKSRVLLGKILSKPCNLLLLDEPTHHLDMESVEALIDALEDFGGAVVLVTHSELILKRLQLDKILVCHQDRQQLFLGSYDDFLEKVGWEEEKQTAPPQKKPVAKKSTGNAKEIKRLEKLIAELEEAQARDYLLLAECSEKGDAKKIQELHKITTEREREIQALYEQLIQL